MAVDFKFDGTCSNCKAENQLVWGSDSHVSYDDLINGRKDPYPLWHCKYCLGGHNQKKINYHKRDKQIRDACLNILSTL